MAANATLMRLHVSDFPKRATQLPLEDLAGTEHRQRLGPHIDAARVLIQLLTKNDEIRCFKQRAWLHDREGVHRFSHCGSGPSVARFAYIPGVIVERPSKKAKAARASGTTDCSSKR